MRQGLRLFDNGATIPLALLRDAPFKTGVVHLVYAPADLTEGDYQTAVASLRERL